ncbi:hypothetical protein M2407_005197 [Serratia sp. BIGb0234]|nr:hypothetical protein [Serratia sp. BIGb0234]
MKATEQWIAEQQHILPDCEWQHVTFTMPDKLWPRLRQQLAAAQPAIFLRGQHPHIHLSVTHVGLCLKHGTWRPIYFKKKVVEAYWRQAVIKLLRESYAEMDLSAAGYEHIRDYREWCQFLEVQFQRRWKIHFAKKTKHTRQNANYLGRYLKRPPMAASALRHYTGGAVVHHYYDRRMQRHGRQVLSQEEMLLRYISHIPSRYFKMVRYYGFLSNRKRGDLLPKIYAALQMPVKTKPAKPGYASLMKQFTNVDPYQCVLCGSRMVFSSAEAGVRAKELLAQRHHRLEKEQ